MKSIKSIFSSLVLGCLLSNINAMSNETVNITSSVVGLSTGVVTSVLLANKDTSSFWNLPISTLAGVGSGFICKAILNNFTPEGRFARAVSKINKVEMDFLGSKVFSPGFEVISFVRKSYISSNWPLALAIEHLDCLRQDLIDASSLLHAALSEAVFKYDFSPKCIACIERSNLLLEKIVGFMEVIKQDPIYNIEFDHYQKDKLVREQMAQQERLHNEDWLQRERFHREDRAQRERTSNQPVIAVVLDS